MYVFTRYSSWNPDSSTLKPNRLQHDRPTACVIAQQSSSTTFASFPESLPQGKIRLPFQKCYYFFFLWSATTYVRFWLAQPFSSNCLYPVLLLTCLGRPKIICPAFPRWAFLASSFSCVKKLASRQTPKLEDQDLSRVISPRRVAFTTAKDSRLAPSQPWGRGP